MKLLSFALLLAIVLTACAPAAGAPVKPSGWQTFASQRYHYTVAFPPGWQAEESAGEWFALGVAAPLDLGIDTFHAKDADTANIFNSTWIMVSSHALEAGETLEKWADRYPTIFLAPYPACKATEPSAKIKIGREDTILFNYYCETTDIKHKAHTAMLTHGGQGYIVVMWNPPATDQADMATFQQFWSSLAFTK